MKTILFFVLLFTCTRVMYAQDLTGEYYLEGVMETASGFQINKDSSFQFCACPNPRPGPGQHSTGLFRI